MGTGTPTTPGASLSRIEKHGRMDERILSIRPCSLRKSGAIPQEDFGHFPLFDREELVYFLATAWERGHQARNNARNKTQSQKGTRRGECLLLSCHVLRSTESAAADGRRRVRRGARRGHRRVRRPVLPRPIVRRLRRGLVPSRRGRGRDSRRQRRRA